MISRDAHEEKARFSRDAHKQKLQNGVSKAYHSIRVTEASQELLGEGTFSRDVREEEA